MKITIYAIINTVNKKVYVGSTENYPKRKRMHIYYMNKGEVSANKALLEDWTTYKRDAFQFNILQQTEEEQRIIELEDEWCIRLDSIANGYNENLPSKISSYESIKKKKLSSSNSQETLKRKKKVYQFNAYTFELIEIFPSRAEVNRRKILCAETELRRSLKRNIFSAIKPRITKGYIFICEDEYTPDMSILKPIPIKEKALKVLPELKIQNIESGEIKIFHQYKEIAEFLLVNKTRIQELKKGYKNKGGGKIQKISHIKGWKLV